MHNKIGQLSEPFGFVAKFKQRGQGVVMQVFRQFARVLKSENADIGRLVLLGILACSLAQRGRAGFHVKNVIHHLKCESDTLGIVIDRIQLRGVQPASGMRAQSDRMRIIAEQRHR